MTRATPKELRARIDELEHDNKRLRTELDDETKRANRMKAERQKFLDACTAGVMHASGVERWVEDMGNAFIKLAGEGHEPRAAIERWIDAMSSVFGRLANEGVEQRGALNGWIAAVLALSGQTRSDLPG